MNIAIHTPANRSNSNVYDFENHLVKHGDISIVYDGDGNRVSKTKGVLTTNYLVDTWENVGQGLRNAPPFALDGARKGRARATSP